MQKEMNEVFPCPRCSWNIRVIDQKTGIKIRYKCPACDWFVYMPEGMRERFKKEGKVLHRHI